ncbi:MAG: type III-B CRISPR module-associated protein Cmr3 [bacterium]|jgi:CRISPR type III-B/RAMP module-associated protein Cmr3
MKNYSLVPEDVLFFRDGKPFANFQKSLFPPSPQTVYGALQAVLLYQWCNDNGISGDIRKVVNDKRGPDSYHNLVVRGPWLEADGKGDLFPCPADLWLEFKSGENRKKVLAAHFAKPSDGDGVGFRSDRFCGAVCASSSAKQPDGWWIDYAGLSAWAKGEHPSPESFVHSDELWTFEPRVGIEISPNIGKVEDSVLFGVEFARPLKKTDLRIRVDCSEDLPENGIIRLGGEGRTVSVERAASPSSFPSASVDAKKLKLALVTPAIFEHPLGIFPRDFDSSTGEFVLAGVALKLVSVAGGGYITCGGWDGASGAPTVLRRAVRPGTVYFCELLSGDPNSLLQAKFTDYPEDAKKGFGTLAIGEWK